MNSEKPPALKPPSAATIRHWANIQDIQIIRQFPQPHVDLFKLGKSCPYWWQLFQTAPVLAFMVARCWHFDGLPETGASERIHKYLSLRRTAICEALGFPSCERTLRILSKIILDQPSHWFPYLFLLRELLKQEPSALEVLGQIPKITTRDLNLLILGAHTTDDVFNFSGDVSHLAWFLRMPTIKRHWIGNLYAAGLHERTTLQFSKNFAGDPFEFDLVFNAFMEPIKPLAAFTNERKVVAYLQECRMRRKVFCDALTHVSQTFESFTWPDSPLEPTDRIVPLLSAAELKEEGQLMNHCVASYTFQMMRGDYFVYRVLTSPRCTLGIRFIHGGWTMDQLCAVDNATVVDPAIIAMVEEWLLSTFRKQTEGGSYFWNYLTAISEHSGLPIRKCGKNDLENFSFQ